MTDEQLKAWIADAYKTLEQSNESVGRRHAHDVIELVKEVQSTRQRRCDSCDYMEKHSASGQIYCHNLEENGFPLRVLADWFCADFKVKP
jgi:hypothetical protein